MTSIKSNQNNLNKRPDGTLEPPAFNDSTAEQYAHAWQQERERIRRERETEKREQKHQEDENNKKSLQEKIKDAVTEKVTERIEDKIIPKPFLGIRDVVKWSQDNQLRVQNLLLGLPDEDFNPGVKSQLELPPEARPDYTPAAFNPPRQWWHDFTSSTPPQAIPLKGDKSYYALWKYTGTVSVAEFRLNIGGSAAATDAVTRTNYANLMRADPVGFSWSVTNPETRWYYNYWNNVFPPGIDSGTITATSNRGILDTYGNAFWPQPYGGQLVGGSYEFSPQEISEATTQVSYSGTGFTRYYPRAKITGAYSANPNGTGGAGQYITVFAPCEMLFAIKISGRQSLAIPEMISNYNVVYCHNTPAGNFVKQNPTYNRFYRGLNYDTFEYDAFLCWIASTLSSSVRQYFPYNDNRQPWRIYPEPYLHEIESNSKYPKPRTTPPPPPPPNKRCECMSCCPQNNSTLEDVKRLIRLVLQKQDETDIEIHRVRVKQGEQSELLGLDKFPYKIDGSPTLYDDIVDVLDSNPLYGIVFKPWLDIAVFNGVVNPKSGKPPIEIANLTEFIAFLNTAKNGEKEIDYIGEPVEMALWDTDPNKPGNQTQKIKPKTIFKAIEAVLNEVTLTQRIIGIDKLPAKVPAKWVTADNTYKMMQAVSKQLGVSAQLEFLKQLVGSGEAQTEITSLVEFLDWQSDQLDDVLGDWEIEVNIADGDLIKAGEQGTTAYVLNMASAMQKTIEASMASNISEKAIINMLTRVLIELQGMKQEIGKSGSQVDCIRDYLGFPTTTKVVKVPAHCNFPKPDKDSKDSKATTKVEDLATFLEGTSLDIEVETYEAKGTYQDILVDLQQAAAITRAKDYQRVGSVKDVGTLLTGLATAYGLLKPSNDPKKNGGKMPPDSFEAFCEAVENDHSGVTGRVSSTPDAPYGKPRKNRPRIREIGKGKGNADA